MGGKGGLGQAGNLSYLRPGRQQVIEPAVSPTPDSFPRLSQIQMVLISQTQEDLNNLEEGAGQASLCLLCPQVERLKAAERTRVECTGPGGAETRAPVCPPRPSVQTR